MFDIISIGSATRDVFLQADEFEKRPHQHSPTGQEQCFPLGSKVETKKLVLTTGGGGTNAAVTFARQGWKTAGMGVVGEDANGQAVLEELKREGVSTKYFQKHRDDLTAYSAILAHSSGERTILSYKGEGQHFNLTDSPIAKLKARWFFFDSLGGNYEFLRALVERAQSKKIKMAFNPGGKELAHGLEKLKPILEKIDIFITNKEEGAQLLNDSGADHKMILRQLGEIIPGFVAVTDGHQGVLVKDLAGKIYSAGVPNSPIVERTGAGDAWSSGFVSQLMRDSDPVKAIQFATANASSVVTQFGAKAGILKKGDWGPWPLVEVKSL